MLYTEKIRIRPNKSQRILIDKILWHCKCTYNRLLEIHNETWLNEKKTLSRYDYNNLFKNFEKPDHPIHSQVIQNVGARLANAFSRFFNKKLRSSRPKFKSIKKFRSFTYPQNIGFSLDLKNKRIRLGKFGKVKAVFTREITGTPKSCTIKKFPCGHYYAFIVVEEPENSRIIPVRQRTKVGIDLGVSRFFTTHDGKYFESPRFLRCNLEKLRRAQRKLSRKKIGSKNREKARLKVAKLHEKVKNARRDHHFKVAHYLVNTYDQVICEDLEASKMFRKKYESKQRRALLDVALSEFLEILDWMGHKYSCEVTKVPPEYTSQMCSGCGTVVKKDLSVRTHICPHCGLVIDRDINAAINILNRGNKLPGGTTGGVVVTATTPMLVELVSIAGLRH